MGMEGSAVRSGADGQKPRRHGDTEILCAIRMIAATAASLAALRWGAAGQFMKGRTDGVARG